MATMYDDDTREELIAEIEKWKQQSAKNASKAWRCDLALRMARHWGIDSRGFAGGASNDLADWVDGGMSGPLLWPSSPGVRAWLAEQGFEDCNGRIGMRATMTMLPQSTS